MNIVAVCLLFSVCVAAGAYLLRKLIRLNKAIRALEEGQSLHELGLSVEDLQISRNDAHDMRIERAKELARLNRVGIVFILLLSIGLAMWIAAMAIDIVPQSKGELLSLENIQP